MTGSLLQLAANNDGNFSKIMLGNPKISHFKNVLKKTVNFSVDTKLLQFENKVFLGKENVCKITNEGMLLSKIYLYIELSELVSKNNNEKWKGYVNGIGFSIIKNISFHIGGILIDKIDSNFLDIYSELYDRNMDELVNKFYTDIGVENNSNNQKIYVPIPFWFCNDYGNILPIEALEHQEVKIIVEFRNLNEIVKSDINNLELDDINIDSYIIADYINTDKEIQSYFKLNKHIYLIEQTQILPDHNISTLNLSTKIDLDFRLFIKEIMWIIIENTNNRQDIETGNNWLTYTSFFSKYGNTFSSCKITLDGTDRINYMDAEYYRKIIPYKYYKYIPRKNIYSYSFNIKPLLNNETLGFCNFSKINKGQLHLNFNHINKEGGICNGIIKVYAKNYNLLLIENNKAGLVFMN
jgi:hypothetical protein